MEDCIKTIINGLRSWVSNGLSRVESSLSRKVTALSGKVTDLSGRVTTLSRKVTALSEDVTDLFEEADAKLDKSIPVIKLAGYSDTSDAIYSCETEVPDDYSPDLPFVLFEVEDHETILGYRIDEYTYLGSTRKGRLIRINAGGSMTFIKGFTARNSPDFPLAGENVYNGLDYRGGSSAPWAVLSAEQGAVLKQELDALEARVAALEGAQST